MEQSFRHTLKDTTSATVEALRVQLRQWESHRGENSAGWSSSEPRAWITGCEPLDAHLPTGGWSTGRLIEWLADGPGSGVELFVLQVARTLLESGVQAGSSESRHAGRHAWVVVDREAHFYPPVTLAWNMDPRQLVIVRPQTAADELWALDQSLRCPAITLVTAWMPYLAPKDFRRLQLAAEQGGTVGCLIRPAQVKNQPSWSDLRVLVEPVCRSVEKAWQRGAAPGACRRWRLEILRCRGGRTGRTLGVELDEQSGRMREWIP